MSEASGEITTAVAVLASQMGELKHAVDGTLRDHGRRISVLEEKEIRRQEREATEDRIRKALQEEHGQHEQNQHQRATIALARWQVYLGFLLAFVTLAGVVVALAQTL